MMDEGKKVFVVVDLRTRVEVWDRRGNNGVIPPFTPPFITQSFYHRAERERERHCVSTVSLSPPPAAVASGEK